MTNFKTIIVSLHLAIGGVLGVSACVSAPVSSVDQGGQASAIVFVGFPTDAEAKIDGVSVGNVSEFDGKSQSLGVTPGAHLVTVTTGGNVILERKIYVGRNSTLTVTR